MPIHRLSDSRLIRRSQQGDRDAFVALVQRYDERLRGLTYGLVAGREAMDRVLRVAYLKAWRDIVRADPDDDAGTWLYRIVYNACIDELRRERRRIEAPASSGSSPASGTGSADDPVVAALTSLSPEERVVTVLVDREGFTPDGAARILGLDLETLDARLANARSRLAAAVPARPPRSRPRPGTDAGASSGSAPRGARPPRPARRPPGPAGSNGSPGSQRPTSRPNAAGTRSQDVSSDTSGSQDAALGDGSSAASSGGPNAAGTDVSSGTSGPDRDGSSVAAGPREPSSGDGSSAEPAGGSGASEPAGSSPKAAERADDAASADTGDPGADTARPMAAPPPSSAPAATNPSPEPEQPRPMAPDRPATMPDTPAAATPPPTSRTGAGPVTPPTGAPAVPGAPGATPAPPGSLPT